MLLDVRRSQGSLIDIAARQQKKYQQPQANDLDHSFERQAAQGFVESEPFFFVRDLCLRGYIGLQAPAAQGAEGR